MGSQTPRKARQCPAHLGWTSPAVQLPQGTRLTPHLDSPPRLRGESNTGGPRQDGTTGLDAEVQSFGRCWRLWAGLPKDGNQVVPGTEGAGTQRWEAGGTQLSIPMVFGGYVILISPENLLPYVWGSVWAPGFLRSSISKFSLHFWLRVVDLDPSLQFFR